jgi:hypothetical protein
MFPIIGCRKKSGIVVGEAGILPVKYLFLRTFRFFKVSRRMNFLKSKASEFFYSRLKI